MLIEGTGGRFARTSPGAGGVITQARSKVHLPVPALVHDYLLVMRGAERTFAAMADAWPGAPVYTLLYDRDNAGERFGQRSVRTSPLQKLRVGQNGFRRMLPLFPPAADRLGSGRHELVVSSSSAFAHRTAPAKGGVHVCYCHSPFRYAWHERERALREVPASLSGTLSHVLDRIRSSDVEAANGLTHIIANSRLTKERIARYWGRDSVVVHPPVEVERFSTGVAEDWFLTVGEITAHKRTEEALIAARRAGVKMKVVGTGPEHRRLEAQYGDVAEFLGRVDDAELTTLYARARAFVMPNVEEFGIAAVEAQAAGRPVLAINRGGATETVIDGLTGILVDDDDGLADAMANVDFDRFLSIHCVDQANTFSTSEFQAALRREVERAWVGSRG